MSMAAETRLLTPAHAYHRLRVADIVDETADARSFVLEVPHLLRTTFTYRAGQFLTFRVPWQDTELSRCYSLSSSPECDSMHQVTVKRVAGGRASNWLNDCTSIGDALEVLPPAGRFVLREERTNPIALFAAGSGITPVFSLLKTALSTTIRQVLLVYANKDDRSIIFQRDLLRLQREHSGRLELLHNIDDRDGLLTKERVARQLDAWRTADYYICGPAPFMDLVETVVRARGVPREHILIERFVSGSALAANEVCESARPQRTGTFQARWQGRLHLVAYQPGQTLLQAAVAGGVDPPFSCEEGYCSSCRARLVRGQVHMPEHECLSAGEVAEGAVLACQAYPASAELEIDWD